MERHDVGVTRQTGMGLASLVGHGTRFHFCPPCSRQHTGLIAVGIPEAVQ